MDPQGQEKLSPLKYLILLDFQTVWDNKQPRPPCCEIIELNAVIFYFTEAQHKKIGEFRRLVKPIINRAPIELKNEKNIEAVLEDFADWLSKIRPEKELNVGTSAVMTWGGDNVQNLLKQLRIKKKPAPKLLGSCIDLKYFLKMTTQGHNLPTKPHDWCKMMEIASIKDLPQYKELSKGQKYIKNCQNILAYLCQSKKFKLRRKTITKIYSGITDIVSQEIEYLLVLDFQATCEDNVKLKPCSEIIELPVMVVDLKQRKIISTFHEYVTPKFNPILTKFCTELTGITQEMVDKKNDISVTLENLDKWIFSQPYLHSKNFVFMTCGDWDLANCLRKECREKNIEPRQYLKSYINIKQPVIKLAPELNGHSGMMGMLKHFNIDHEGRHHSGIDDVKNICAIALKLLEQPGFSYSKDLIKVVR